MSLEVYTKSKATEHLKFGFLSSARDFDRFTSLLCANSTWAWGLRQGGASEREQWFKAWRPYSKNRDPLRVPAWTRLQENKQDVFFTHRESVDDLQSRELDGLVVLDDASDPRSPDELTHIIQTCAKTRIPMNVFCQTSLEDYEELEKVQPLSHTYHALNQIEPLYFNGFYYLTLEVFEGGTIECTRELQRNTNFPKTYLLSKDHSISPNFRKALEDIFLRCLPPTYTTRGFGAEEWDKLYKEIYGRSAFEEEIQFIQKIVFEHELPLVNEDYLSFDGFCQYYEILLTQFGQNSFAWDMLRAFRLDKPFRRKQLSILD